MVGIPEGHQRRIGGGGHLPEDIGSVVGFARPAVSFSRVSHAMKNLLKMEQLADGILSRTAIEQWNFEEHPEHPVIVQFRTAVYDACRYKLHHLYSDMLIWERLLASIHRRVVVLRDRLLRSYRGVELHSLTAALREDFLPALRNIGRGSEYLAVAHNKDSVAAGLVLFRRELVLHAAVQAALQPGVRPEDVDALLASDGEDDGRGGRRGARGADSPALAVAS